MSRSTRASKLLALAVLAGVPAAAVAGPFTGTALAGTAKAAAPVITASVGASGVVTNQATATFSWTDASTNPVFSCSLDGAKWQSCTSSVTTTVLDGSHQFVVRASLNRHRWSASTFRWTVDTIPPARPAVSQPNDPTSATSATITFSDTSAVARYACSLDNGAVVVDPCGVSPALTWNLNNLSEAQHTATVTAFDAAGNSASRSVTWTVDHTAPNSPTIDTPPAPVTRSTSANIAFHDDDPSFATFNCVLDGVATAGCTSPFSTGPLSEGPHWFSVTALDAANNASDTDRVDWTVDVTPPQAPMIMTAPADPTDQTTATIGYADSDPTAVDFRCFLNGAQQDCPGGSVTYPTVNGTTYNFHVEALDAAGNTSDSPTTTWTVDTTATGPAQFVSGPDSPSNDTSPTFTFDVGPSTTTPDTFVCALDPANSADLSQYVDCASGADTGYQTAVSGDTTHHFFVRAVYGTGTSAVPSAPTEYSWVLDTVAPAAPTFSTVPSNPSRSSTAVFSFASDPNVQFTCSLDGATATVCASPVTYQNLADGSHTFVVNAIDAAGNVSSSSDTWTINTAPAPQPAPAPTSAPVAQPAVQPVTQPASGSNPADTTAPTASLTTPGTLTGAAVATFSEQVNGLDTNAVRLVVSGSTTSLPVRLACLAGTTPASCAGTFTAVQVSPVKPLVPGQHYTVSLGAGATHDLAGNASSAASADFRAARTLEEDNAAVAATWATVKDKGAYGGSFVREHLAGATATWGFSGTSLTWWTVTGPDQGMAAVYVDGVRKATFDDYAAAKHTKVGRTLKGLKKGKHTLKISVLGTKSSKSKGTFVAVDAFTVGKSLTKSPALATGLRRLAGSRFLAGHASVADLAGQAVSVTFRGTSVTWVTSKANNQGKAAVYVDGVLKATFDDYAAKTSYNVKHTIGHLADKVHTIKIVVLGKHHKAGKGNLVTVDRFTIG